MSVHHLRTCSSESRRRHQILWNRRSQCTYPQSHVISPFLTITEIKFAFSEYMDELKENWPSAQGWRAEIQWTPPPPRVSFYKQLTLCCMHRHYEHTKWHTLLWNCPFIATVCSSINYNLILPPLFNCVACPKGAWGPVVYVLMHLPQVPTTAHIK